MHARNNLARLVSLPVFLVQLFRSKFCGKFENCL